MKLSCSMIVNKIKGKRTFETFDILGICLGRLTWRYLNLNLHEVEVPIKSLNFRSKSAVSMSSYLNMPELNNFIIFDCISNQPIIKFGIRNCHYFLHKWFHFHPVHGFPLGHIHIQKNLMNVPMERKSMACPLL